MYSKMAISAALRVPHECRQINSALMVLQKVSIAALKLLYLSTRVFQCFWPAKMRKYFTDDIAFEATNNLAFTFAIFDAFSNVCQGRFVVSHSDNFDSI